MNRSTLGSTAGLIGVGSSASSRAARCAKENVAAKQIATSENVMCFFMLLLIKGWLLSSDVDAHFVNAARRRDVDGLGVGITERQVGGLLRRFDHSQLLALRIHTHAVGQARVRRRRSV